MSQGEGQVIVILWRTLCSMHTSRMMDQEFAVYTHCAALFLSAQPHVHAAAAAQIC